MQNVQVITNLVSKEFRAQVVYDIIHLSLL